MDAVSLQKLRSRADAKLRYAQIHLDEMRRLDTRSATDIERAFEESFLFHLLGAKEALLVELNEYYGLGCDRRKISLRTLRDALKKRGVISREIGEIYQTEKEQDSWLFDAKEMRDHGAHVAGVARGFHQSNDAKIGGM